MVFTDTLLERLHRWTDETEATPCRVVVHDQMMAVLERERREAHPPLLERAQDGGWQLMGVPIYSTSHIELGAILIE